MIHFGKVKFCFGRSKPNYHKYFVDALGTSHSHTICGPKFRHVNLNVHLPSTGHRFIFYFPSGAWWMFDVYIDRRQLGFRRSFAKRF